MTEGLRTVRLTLLAWVAGAVDTFGYLTLGRVFTTHITGNTAALGIAIVEHRFADATLRGWPIPLFFAGAIAGAALVDNADDERQVARALRVEAALLAGFVALGWSGALRPSGGQPAWMIMIALLATAMGIQNAALTHPGTRGTHSTHITGPATDLAIEVVRAVKANRRAEFSATRLQRLAARIVGFFVGAVTGAALVAVGWWGLLVPALMLVALSAVAQARHASVSGRRSCPVQDDSERNEPRRSRRPQS